MKSRLEGMFYIAWAGRSGRNKVGWMRRDDGSFKELGGEQRKVVMDREDKGFFVKMGNAGHLHAARGGTEGTVL